MDRYQRVEKPREETPTNENEIRVTSQGRMRNYITYATSLLQEKGSNEIIFKAMGRAINKTVMIVELIKRRIVGLHQNTATGSIDITDTWEPLEEGLLPYQSPLPTDQVKPLPEFDYEGDGSPAGRGRGRSGRGRGRARGKFDDMGMGFFVQLSFIIFSIYKLCLGNGTMDYGDGGWDDRGHGYGRGGYPRGWGRGFRGRGRGGRYGGRPDYQQEMGGYNGEAPVRVQGRGRGRGRGQTRGRGHDSRSNGPIHASIGGV
uniref:TATA-binding protein-associated factor 2N isoform X2 n=1 Tax=Elaeis guineensis var. tenera TaxID=51953 RepID=A0A6J0PRW8_ELAGV|nr:TATA-binding protein-associated factor 2N isoform X2 [Elaeis guineensis]